MYFYKSIPQLIMKIVKRGFHHCFQLTNSRNCKKNIFLSETFWIILYVISKTSNIRCIYKQAKISSCRNFNSILMLLCKLGRSLHVFGKRPDETSHVILKMSTCLFCVFLIFVWINPICKQCSDNCRFNACRVELF